MGNGLEEVGFLTQQGGEIMWEEGKNQFADTEADARARMLIYLLENNLIEDQLRTPTEAL